MGVIAEEEEKSGKPATGVRLARAAFWSVWFVVLPFVFACTLVSVLTPPSGIEATGAFGWLEAFVRDQPVPVGIGAFALMNVAMGMARKRLPLSRLASAPLRPDIPEETRGKSQLREYAESIVLAVGVALALRTFVVEAFKIPTGSMIPTLQVGDHIFVNKLSYGPAVPFTHTRLWSKMPPDRGDVMVFAYPEDPAVDFIKRVIAKPGDKLEAKGGHPWINGWEVPSCHVGAYSYDELDSLSSHHEGDLFVEFLEDLAYLTLYDYGTHPAYQGPFLVKPGEVYVMGDNRNNSHDSRMWFGGAGGGVPYENIRGRALFVWLSYSDQHVDTSRLLAPVMGRPRLPRAMGGLEPALTKCLQERPPPGKSTPPNP